MNDSFLCFWVEKELIHKAIIFCEDTLKFKYIENIVCTSFNPSANNFLTMNESEAKKSSKSNTNLNYLLQKSDYTYFSKTKITLLLFRKIPIKGKTSSLILNHQRNEDVVFKLMEDNPSIFVYHVIETLISERVVKGERTLPFFLEINYEKDDDTKEIKNKVRKNWKKVVIVD